MWSRSLSDGELEPHNCPSVWLSEIQPLIVHIRAGPVSGQSRGTRILKICLVGATHISYNPRLVREADSLTAAGHDVRVVAPMVQEDHGRQDRRLSSRRNWCFQPFDYRPRGVYSRLRYWKVRGLPRLERAAFKVLAGADRAGRAYLPGSADLQRLVESEQADWFIAHAQGALPLAATAASRWKARLGFDMEDILTLSKEEPVHLLRAIEKEYLPRTEYVSVPSQAIARRVLEGYPSCQVLTLYNVFPRALAATLRRPAQRARTGQVLARLHWFGQTIGLRRGLRFAIEAVAPLRDQVELHFRGSDWSSGFGEIRSLAEQRGVRFVHHSLIDHDDLIASLGNFDIGLALEQPSSPQYELTVTNKLFSYLLGGLAIAATDTSGQREVLQKIPRAGFLVASGKTAELTDGLAAWLEDRDRLLAAQTASWEAARERFCWDIEQKKFLARIES